MRRVLISAGVLFVLVLAVAAGLFLGDESGSSKPRSTPLATQRVMPKKDTEYLESKLNDASRKEQAKALVAGLRDDYLRQKKRMLPVGTTLKVDPSFIRENGGIIVNATTATQGNWTLHLVREGDRWLILYTEQK